MKKFRFPLEKLRAWRHLELENEQARMRALLNEELQVLRRREALASDLERARTSVWGGGTVSAVELAALNQFAIYAGQEDRRLDRLLGQIRQAICQQRSVLLAARREAEALNQLRDRRLAQWRADAGREEENIVAELVVQRWKPAEN